MPVLPISLLLSCHTNVFFLNFILNPTGEFVDGKQEAKVSVCANWKECMWGAGCVLHDSSFATTMFFCSAGGQQSGRCK